MKQTILDVQAPPKSAVLQDGTEVRLVPLERTGRPLYVSRDGVPYSFTRGQFRRVKPTFTSQPFYKGKPVACRKFIYQAMQTCFNHIYIHHAVLLAWVGPRPEGYETDHINGNKMDNRVENLQWVTRAENARRRKEMHAARGEGYKGKKLTELGKKAWKKRGKLIQLTIPFNFE